MLENPIRNTCLIPHSFVMTRSECDYCSAKEHSYVMIAYLFGLKSCSAHLRHAHRDCRAYMHREGYVKLSDARENPSIARFLEKLDGGFPVIRTSGLLEGGWKLRKDLLKRIDSRWHIPAYTEEPVEMTKYVSIEQFLNTRLGGFISTQTVQDVIKELNSGMYRQDAMEYEMAVDREASPTVEECKGIIQGVTEDGRIVRVMQVPDSSTHRQAVEDTDPVLA